MFCVETALLVVAVLLLFVTFEVFDEPVFVLELLVDALFVVLFPFFSVVVAGASIAETPSIGIFLHTNVAFNCDVDSPADIENPSILNAKFESSSISLINSEIPT